MQSYARWRVPMVNGHGRIYSWDSNKGNHNIVVSQYGMSPNRIHKPTQAPASSFQKVILSRKIMAIDYIRKKHEDIPASLFGGINGICRNGYLFVRESSNLH